MVSKLQLFVRTRLWLQIIIAMILGVGVGLILSPTGGGLFSLEDAKIISCWLALPGHIFLALIQMIVVPLITSSIILGISESGNTTFLKKVGFRIAPYFIVTTVIAVVIGTTITLWIEPGKYIDSALVQESLADARALNASMPEPLNVDLPLPLKISQSSPPTRSEPL